MNPGADLVLFGAGCLGAAVWASWRWDTDYHWDVAEGPSKAPPGGSDLGCAHRSTASSTPTPGAATSSSASPTGHDGHAEPPYRVRSSHQHPGRSARSHLRTMAAEGRTVFLSSHLMGEMSQTADQLLVIGRGHIITAGSVQQVIDSVAGGAVRVRSPRAVKLAAALATIASPEAGMLEVGGTTAEHVGAVAFRDGLPLSESSPRRASLEEAYLSLTQDAVEYRSEPATARSTPVHKGQSR